MNLRLSLVLTVIFAITMSSFSSHAEDPVPVETESNYLVNPRGCMGLDENPNKDGLIVVLTYDEVWTVDGQKIVKGPGDKFAYVTMLCSLKPTLESCQGLRGVFTVKPGSGAFGMPDASEFRCLRQQTL